MNYQDRIKLMNKIMKESETVATTDSNSDITKNGTEEVYNVMTNEGYVNQLNRLYTKGSIDKEYYNQQVDTLKNSYPTAYNLIKEKLIMDV